MTIIDLYFKHFPGAGWGRLHSFLSEWDILQIYVPYPDAEVQFKIDGARKVRMELAKNWILKNSEILNKKDMDNSKNTNMKVENKVAKFRKKPVVIEAFKYRLSEPAIQDSIIEWVKRNGGMASYNEDKILIETLEGPITASLGDFIIKGVNGEFCPCKPDIFEKTYERVEEFGEASERGYQESNSQSFDWPAFNKELNRKAREYSGTFEGLEELDEKTVKQDLTPEEVLKKMAAQPLEFRRQPDMYELVSESYYMLQELTEKKRQEEEIDTETFEMHKKAAIDAMTPEEMIAQVNMTNSAIDVLKKQRPDFPIELISDGYHSFKELYEFRMLYNALLFNEWAKTSDKKYTAYIKIKDEYIKAYISNYAVHKSWKHHDGEPCFGGGWFIVSAMLPTGLISNHYEGKYWDYFKVPEAEKALFEFDGHTSNDVLNRLSAFLVNK